MTFKKTNVSKAAQKSAQKPAQKSASEPTNKSTPPAPSAVPATVLVHDLIGGAVIALPLELKEIVGDEGFKDILADMANHVMTAVIRRPGHVIYVHAQLMAPDLSTDLKSEDPGLDKTASAEVSAATNPSGMRKPLSNKAGKSAGRSPKDKA